MYWKIYVSIIILCLMWILCLYKQISNLKDERIKNYKETIKEINKLREKEK